MKTAVGEARKGVKNSLFLTAGDEFQVRNSLTGIITQSNFLIGHAFLLILRWRGKDS